MTMSDTESQKTLYDSGSDNDSESQSESESQSDNDNDFAKLNIHSDEHGEENVLIQYNYDGDQYYLVYPEHANHVNVYMQDENRLHKPLDLLTFTLTYDGKTYTKKIKVIAEEKYKLKMGPFVLTYSTDFDHAWRYDGYYSTNHYNGYLHDKVKFIE